MSFDFLDENLMTVLQIDEEKIFEESGWKMYFGGASNALGRGVGAVLISLEGNHCPFTTKLSFDCTNVSTYLSNQDCTYVDMESPPINLSRCDWTPVMVNLFNKS